MSMNSENSAAIEAALLQGAAIRRVIELHVEHTGSGLMVGAKVDLEEQLTMKEVSAVLAQAKRRLQAAAPEAEIVYLEPDVWIDPDAVQPTTSSIVMLGID
ncbi:MAG: hypothetical protein KDB25_06000 [Leucobacter sp.]|nr:hypothetical protein [Leucobacter sp.]